MRKKENIRNFSIIAHIDHGKSTLADRLIEKTQSVAKREINDQMLDSMELEQERGITIKLKSVKLKYKANDGKVYDLNLIDTPGHVDFTYEVSRSLKACEGAILVVDASQGVEAQTLANTYLALEQDLEILPVLNKVDLPSARIDETKEEIENQIGLDTENIPLVSAKTGLNIDDVLEDIIENVPAPEDHDDKPLKALIFDSYYDSYRGVICYVRIFEGSVKAGDEILMMASGKSYEVTGVGYTMKNRIETKDLKSGDVGFIEASIKDIRNARVGDTITLKNNPTDSALSGYKEVLPMVYSGIYPAEGESYNKLKDSLEKLQVNDAALVFEQENSQALGVGLRCGFLGLLHMDIITERLEREYDLDIIATAPSVIYRVKTKGHEEKRLENPNDFPAPSEIDYVKEPITISEIMTPKDYIGPVMELAQSRRGELIDMSYIDENRVLIKYKIPLNEVIYNFFDSLKSRSKGYASLDYEVVDYEESNLIKLDIKINEERVDALSTIVHKDFAYARGRSIVEKLKDQIPRQQFAIPIQATIDSKVIARETVKALRKDVIAKCYGGDISRKKKLLEKQKEGKKRMRQLGSVQIPQDAFLAVLKYDDE
ncbi:translation elongation factor 4 [Anaerococcus hydrogenalis]|uniref:Elongation factor 4 n=1 Tax=Anaerococcus hydrogenalis TaxID=33029 RepID=A0A2N6UJI5_9FIRM|nr:translation elongation factor 4 [Anaerococcus hydrogenalis]MDK7695112.1 translation elongation factor 4 [Anaerococcus hydrogenalis]MDK7696913.1 translation elongation factor 4 [Anaerococcus hydrogenalis]MDK7708139.1 translation elongation factor 4 [Anaerococcus hydrogenalis]PMC81909.1 elongation factor 4 [Anaerococcus hydrogenalis]